MWLMVRGREVVGVKDIPWFSSYASFEITLGAAFLRWLIFIAKTFASYVCLPLVSIILHMPSIAMRFHAIYQTYLPEMNTV
jgi:hypothetical protein